MSSESVAAFDVHNVISTNLNLTGGLVDQIHLNVGRPCADPESFVRGGGSISDNVFLLFLKLMSKGGRIQITLKHSKRAIMGPPA